MKEYILAVIVLLIGLTLWGGSMAGVYYYHPLPPTYTVRSTEWTCHKAVEKSGKCIVYAPPFFPFLCSQGEEMVEPVASGSDLQPVCPSGDGYQMSFVVHLTNDEGETFSHSPSDQGEYAHFQTGSKWQYSSSVDDDDRNGILRGDFTPYKKP